MKEQEESSKMSLADKIFTIVWVGAVIFSIVVTVLKSCNGI